MLPADADLRAALKDSKAIGGVRAIARYGARQTPVTLAPAGAIQFRGDSTIQATASSLRAYGQGDSLVPKSVTDPLAPYGQELALWRTVQLGDLEPWAIPLGVYRITGSGAGTERFRGDTVLDWIVDVSIKDRFEAIIADDFVAVETPKAGNSVWDEIRRLVPRFPVAEAVGTGAVPPATAYESRYDAIVELLRIIGAVPHLTREGAVSARKADRWLTEAIPDFEIEGTISWNSGMTNDYYNQVQVTNPNDPKIVAYSSITDMSDPLAVGRAGGRTYKQSSPIYATVAAAQSAANTIRSRLSTKRSRTVTVECTNEALLLELGDFGWMRDTVQDRSALGEVSGIRVPFDPTQPPQVELIVAEEA